ncbi:MAG: aminopeptidase P family protein [Deltaproteobacteria bacterium]|nr:aminopeptidase P family protein [Deltaproteobacteria bacterium]
MAEHGIAAYLVPRADEHQNEYVPASEERLRWISGFSGSAGLAVIGRAHAAVFVDGRYVLQVRQQSDAAFWEHRHVIETPFLDWVKQHLAAGDRVGFDPRLHTVGEVKRHRTALAGPGVELVAIQPNLVDRCWADRPPPPRSPVVLHPLAVAGETSAAKRVRMAAELAKAGLDALVVSASDSLAWLFNVRGADVPMTPFVLGYAILRADAAATLFVDPAKVGVEVRAALECDGGGAVAIAAPADLEEALAVCGGKKVRLDAGTGNVFLHDRLEAAGAAVDVGADPCQAAKARKNAVEIEGMRRAHHRDGVALVRFFAWLDAASRVGESEWTLAEVLGALRARGARYRGPSFDTISALGGNAAQPHYRVAADQARVVAADDLYLVDSGGQYLDGTTDVTRVVMLGAPTAEMRRRYTEVLRGMIAVSRARFPFGTTGAQLDPLARQFLWASGVDFDHGTGHGVGSYLSVHEGPQSISKRSTEVKLEPGMVLSVEPGYYKPDAFGIRIENLVVVIEAEPQPEGAELRTLAFETLTVAPLERRLIDVAALGPQERAWVDDYHAAVLAALTPDLDAADAAWLARAAAPLGR